MHVLREEFQLTLVYHFRAKKPRRLPAFCFPLQYAAKIGLGVVGATNPKTLACLRRGLGCWCAVLSLGQVLDDKKKSSSSPIK